MNADSPRGGLDWRPWSAVIALLAAGNAAARAESLSTIDAPPRQSVHGFIRVRGQIPMLPLLAEAGGTVENDVPDESLVVGASGGLANVFVWLRDPPRPAPMSPTGEKRLLKISSRYVPRAVILPVGESLRVVNADNLPLSFRSTGMSNTQLSLTMPAQNAEGYLVASRYISRNPEPLPVPIRSEYHHFLRAHLLVLDHPYAAVTDDHGEFRIDGLPAGAYELTIWHERVGYLEKRLEVTVAPEHSPQVQLEYRVDRFLRPGEAAPNATTQP